MTENSIVYSIVVPVYNGAGTVTALVADIEENMASIGHYEIILVDDCSTDQSWQLLKSLKVGRPHMRIYRLSKNFGQAGATLCGIYKARGQTIINIDDDLQYPASEIPKMIAYFEANTYFMVLGVPRHKMQPQSFKLAERLLRLFFRIFPVGHLNGRNISSSFRILSARLNHSPDLLHGRVHSLYMATYFFDDRFIGRLEVRHRASKNKKSRYSFSRRLDQLLSLLLLNYTNPLKLLFWPMMLAFLLSVAAGGCVLMGISFFTIEMALFAGALFTGLILFSLLVTGIYLARIYGMQTGTAPYFVIEKYE